MPIFSSADFDGHEAVHAFFDRTTHLKGFIAIHSTALGPGFGGCRMWPYASEEEAVHDALRLSRGMSYKNAMAGLSYGGGKAVIIGDPRHDKSPALFEAFGRVVQSLGGRYITAEDVGTSVDNMRSIARATGYVSGIPQAEGYRGGDPSPRTALGTFEGLRAAAEVAFERKDLGGLGVAVQGVGNVGYHLCRYLHQAGARLVVADINAANVARVEAEFGASAVAPDAILAADAEVLAPCALGGVLNAKTIPALKAKVVAGAANNQLATEADGERLHKRGIVYAPDYVINAGGIISVAAERDGNLSEAEVTERIARIYGRTLEILRRSRASGRPPHEVADEMAREFLRLGRPAGSQAGA